MSSAAARWLAPIEELQAALAVPSLLILPVLVGGGVLRVLPIRAAVRELDVVSEALIDWLLGALTLVTIAAVLQLGEQAFLLKRYGLIAMALALLGAVVVQTKPLPSLSRPLRFKGATSVAFVTAIVIAMAPKAITAWYTPFPRVSHNFLSPLFYSQPALRMLEHGYMELDNLAHAPGLLTLTAVHTQLYGADPMSILWMGPFLLLAAVGAGLFLWTRELTGRWATALLVAGVGGFVLTGTPLFQSTPVVLRSNTLLFALVPLCLYIMHRAVAEDSAPARSKMEALVTLQLSAGVLFVVMNVDRLGWASNDVRVPLMLGTAIVLGALLHTVNRKRWHWAPFMALFAITVGFQVFHIYEGAVYLVAIIVYGMGLALRDSIAQPVVAVALALGAVGFFFLQNTEVVTFPRDFSLASSLIFGSTYDEFPIRFVARANALRTVLSWEVVVLLSIGAAGFFVRRPGGYGRAVIIAAAVMLLAYIMPDARANRAGRSLAPFIAVLLVAGADHTGWLARQATRWIDRDRPIVQDVVQFSLVAAVFAAILLPFLHFNTSNPKGQSYHSTVFDVEYELADWFNENTGENVRIVSDYRTMQILTSFSNKVSLTERPLYPQELSEFGLAQVGQIKVLALPAPTSVAAYTAIQGLKGHEPEREREFLEAAGMSTKDVPYYVVWTGRTSLWTQGGTFFPARQPGPALVPAHEVASFQDPTYFRLLEDFDGRAYIFEVLPEPALRGR